MTVPLLYKPIVSAASTRLMFKASVEVLQDAGTRKEAKKPVRSMVTNGLDQLIFPFNLCSVEMRSLLKSSSQSLSTSVKVQEAVLWRQLTLSKSFQLFVNPSRLSVVWKKLSVQ